MRSVAKTDAAVAFRERWEYIKNLTVPLPRFAFVSVWYHPPEPELGIFNFRQAAPAKTYSRDQP